MVEYTAPGVYVAEGGPPPPIEGVATATAAFLGEAQRGPVRPRLITSMAEYRRHFGGLAGPGKYLPDAITGFFENGGKRAVAKRIDCSAVTE